MKEFYILKSLSEAEEFIRIKGNVANIKIPVMKSEIQHLDKKRVVFDISEEGGLEIPDLICKEGIVLVSDRVKQLFDAMGIEYVFWKEADIHSERFGIHETFWIIVPPRIDCLDLDKSEWDPQWDFEEGIVPMLESKKIVIRPELTGRFQIFKILGVMDNNIYVDKALYEAMNSCNYNGITFIKGEGGRFDAITPH